MIRGLLFDLGGTLDGDGVHWLDRFCAIYAVEGLALSRDVIRAAFDEAERRASLDEPIRSASLAEMVQRHVGWQLEWLRSNGHLPPADVPTAAADRLLGARIGKRFVETTRGTAAANVPVLRRLKSGGYVLGVVSNGCGNVETLCRDLEYAPLLSLILDSRRVGLHKPDPAIYVLAAARLGLSPSAIMMIGDSFDRDVRPARRAGMRTAWLQGVTGRPCPEPALVDICLSTLAELPEALQARARTVA